MRGIFYAAAWMAAFSALAGCGPLTATNTLSTQSIPGGRPGPEARMAQPSTVAYPATVATGGEAVLVYHPQLGWVRGTYPTLAGLASPLTPRGEAPLELVEACRAAIEAAAAPYGVQIVQAVSAGPARRLPVGGLEAPVEMRLVYRRPNLVEVRQAVLTCRSNAAGAIVGVSA